MKTIDEHFIDWEAYVFGYGYGTGEPHTLSALKVFFECVVSIKVPDVPTYHYETLEKELGPSVAWLMINILCHADVIEYGTSPRYGWLTKHGSRLKAFVEQRTAEELVKLVCERGDDYIVCYPDACNCGPHGYEEGRDCGNPFWKARGR